MDAANEVMLVIGTEAGAVMYHICLPSVFVFERKEAAFGVEEVVRGKKPRGGMKGCGAAATALVGLGAREGVDVDAGPLGVC